MDAAHHAPGGGYRNPWPTGERPDGSFLKWVLQRTFSELPPDPTPDRLPFARPAIARPRAASGEIRATWVGHATFLLQVGGLNVLVDPHWSRRAAPVRWAGPARFVPPGVAWEDLPPVDVVAISHDHYDHLDDRTVRRLAEHFGAGTLWLAPLGFRPWLARRGARRVVELDWWEAFDVHEAGGSATFACLPAQHWCNRAPWDNRERRLWSSWAVAADPGRVYFGGDSGWFPRYPEIGRRAGPFDLVLLPIGAYAPRWFMKRSHMEPEEAVRAYREMGATGVLGGMHWGTFRLTDEDPLEPPVRLRAAWDAAGLAREDLWIPRHGETRVVVSGADALQGPTDSGDEVAGL